MSLVEESYKLTKLLPRNEEYGLAAQIRRAAVSVPANIAEGHGREHLGDYLRHLFSGKRVAHGARDPFLDRQSFGPHKNGTATNRSIAFQ